MKFDIENYMYDNFQKVRKTTSGQITAVCPFCDKFGAFYVNENNGNFICFKCENKGRGFIGVIAQVEDISFVEAKKMMARQVVQFQRRETTTTLLDKIKDLRSIEEDIEFEDTEQVDFDLPEEFIPVFKNGKWNFPIYLKERGVHRETAKAWGMGFCNKGDYGGRIIIPVECPNGNSFVARACMDGIKPKIKNPKGSDHSKLLCGWNMIPEEGGLILCEGPFDAIKLWQYGYSALGMFGKVLHSYQRKLLFARSSDTTIIIMTDPEEIEAPYQIAIQLMMYFEKVLIAKLPDGVDPGSASKKQVDRACYNAIKYNGGRYFGLSDKTKSLKKKLEKFYN